MNPFDLRGPEFLLFFAGCVTVVLIAIWLLRRLLESDSPARVEVADPYQLAFLREGPDAAVEVAMVSLIDRGLLAVTAPETGAITNDDRQPARKSRSTSNGLIVQSDPKAVAVLRRPFEKKVFAWFATPGRRISASMPSLAQCAQEHYQEPLQRLDLLASPRTRFRRALLALGGTALLWLIAGTKISIALSRGRTNIALLILLAIVGSVLCLCLIAGRTTVAGRQMIRSLQGLFEPLHGRAHRIQPGGATNELSVLTALFGLAAVPTTIFPHRDVIRRPAPVRESWSSCGAASSCSSGSSCGGGGCGGGGGGCGGCGS